MHASLEPVRLKFAGRWQDVYQGQNVYVLTEDQQAVPMMEVIKRAVDAHQAVYDLTDRLDASMARVRELEALLEGHDVTHSP